MENDRVCISVLIHKLNQPFFQLRKEYKLMVSNDSVILCHYKKSLVAEKAMIRFLLKSIFIPSIRMLIPNILYYVDEGSVTDRVFHFCCRYPGRFRYTLLNLLSHMWLKQEQLYILSQIINAPEAFCKLFVLFAAKDDSFLDEFVSFCKVSTHYLKSIDLERLLRENHIKLTPQKALAIKRFIDETGNSNLSQ